MRRSKRVTSDSTPFFVVNPNAANGKLRKAWPDISVEIRKRFGRADFEWTRSAGDATRVAREAVAAGHRFIVSVGGDGTNNEVLNGLIHEDALREPDVVMGFVPFGTGGDLRRTLGSEKTITGYLDRLANGTQRKVDIGRADFIDDKGSPATRYFLNIASFGLSGLVDREVNRSSKRLGGTLTFAKATVKSIARYDFPKIEFQVDDGPVVTTPLLLGTIANGQYFGGGMWIAPEAKMDDGFFDCVMVQKTSALTFARHALDVYKGRHLRLPWMIVKRGKRLRASGEEVFLDIDGEAPGRLPAEFVIIPQALNIRTR